MTMRKLGWLVLCLALPLSGCSSGYGVLATVIRGKLAFVIDPETGSGSDCLQNITVTEAWRTKPGNPTVWASATTQDCVNHFPIFYGVALRGPPPPEENAPKIVEAKPLEIGIEYIVNTTTGPSRYRPVGYGAGRFRIRPDGSVENVRAET